MSSVDSSSYIHRTLESALARAERMFPVVVLTGPRQVGKTTLLEQCGHRLCVSLDAQDIRLFAQQDPRGFLEQHPAPILIDEIQYVPQLLPYIKEIVDRRKEKNLYLLTGSQQFNMMQHVTESLAGRAAVLRLLGLSQREKCGQPDSPPFLPTTETPGERAAAVTDVFRSIFRGSYPALYGAVDEDSELFYHSYVQTYIERDVKQLVRVHDELLFFRFMQVLAAQTAQTLNFSSLARDVGVDQKTVKSWVNILQTSGLVYLLSPYFNNATSRAVKTPKLYFTDTGLAAFLARWTSAEALERGNAAGAFFETYVVSEIVKSYWHNGKEAPIWFYRSVNGEEIDLLIERDGVLHPVEIKKKPIPDLKDIHHFRVIREHLHREAGAGAVICSSSIRRQLTPDVSIIPIGCL